VSWPCHVIDLTLQGGFAICRLPVVSFRRQAVAWTQLRRRGGVQAQRRTERWAGAARAARL